MTSSASRLALAAAITAVATLAAGCGGALGTPSTGGADTDRSATTVAAGGQTAGGAPQILVPAPLEVTPWDPDVDNVAEVKGRVLLGETPVVGARVRVGLFEPAPTDETGTFTTLVDATLPYRYAVTVVGLEGATAGGSPLSEPDQAALTGATASIVVAYRMEDLQVSESASGDVVVSGRVVLTDGSAVPSVRIYSYRLTGVIVDADGRPVEGAIVSTRTGDRDYWTVSSPTDADGRYTSFFTASDEAGNDPVPFTVRVAKGDDLFEFLQEETVPFRRLQSAEMDIQLPPAGFAMALPAPRSLAGAVYQGIVVGVAAGGQPVTPLAARWPDAEGRFELTLPAGLRGQTVSLWQAQTQLFSVPPAEPGGEIDVTGWPAALSPGWPQDITRIELP